MFISNCRYFGCWSLILWVSTVAMEHAFSQDSNERLKQMINYLPVQPDVEIDIPTGAELDQCTLEAHKSPPGFVVKDGAGRVLRRFLDTTGNKKLDQLSYYRAGIEVYREIDNSGDGVPDEYRWMGPSGTRWGVDLTGDKKIDQWKAISAEEVGKELFHAIRTKDAERFNALLLTPAEFKDLQIGEILGKEIQQRWGRAKKEFRQFCDAQREVLPTSEFVHSTNGLPGLVAAETYGNQTDLLVYDHATIIFSNKDQYGNLSVGSIVQIDQRNWRLLELPEIASIGAPLTNGGVFFPMPAAQLAGGDSPTPFDPKLAKIYEELDELDAKIAAAIGPAQKRILEVQKAKLLESFVETSEAGEPQLNALMYATDSVVAAYQDQRFPEGLEFLEKLLNKTLENKREGADYIRWRMLTSQYNLANLNGSNEERDQAHAVWLENLTTFQQDYPKSPFAAEALIYLGINYDNEGKEEEAIGWYEEINQRFADTPYGKRARGALIRLQGIGKTFAFVGKDLQGRNFNLQDEKWREKIIVLHFWETWCADGMEQIQKLSEKYKDDVIFVSCNMEMDTQVYEEFMASHPEFSGWIHLHSPGSLEQSALAQQLGIPSEPLLVLVNKQGELAEPMAIFSELERQIERLRRR
jgi:thiol-disulfide isomerase/thioredoxin